MPNSVKKVAFLVLLLLALVFYFSYYKIEVVVPGTGITTTKEGDVTLNAPVSGYIVETAIAEGDLVTKGQNLLVYRNLSDEYQLKKITEGLVADKDLYSRLLEERCFLISDRFSDAMNVNLSGRYDCKNQPIAGGGAGGQYILQFYEDYLEESIFLTNLAIQRQSKISELLSKRRTLKKKRRALKRGKGETIRFYDLQNELTDLNNEVIDHEISSLENKKKVKDKFLIFKMRRAERLLTLLDKIDSLNSEIIEKKNQKSLLTEKLQKSVVRSPVTGSVLEMTSGVSVGTFVQEGAQLFVIKKSGGAQEVDAKFDSRYRHLLHLGVHVKLKLNSPGLNELFDGEIVEISSDSIAYDDQNKGGQRYYRATVIPTGQFVQMNLNPGMDIQVMVVTNNITALEYVLSVIPKNIQFDVW